MSGSGKEISVWWKEAVVYQIYPASFLDLNGDGLGDIKGITSKLDYLKSLGVDVLWLSPIYDSPQADMGYDISNYKDIYAPYGTLADVDELIAELKKRRMRLIMDLVVNHTSNQHAWFLESRSSKDNGKRDWYIWKKPRYDSDGNRKPPNNWGQILGEANSTWIFDETTEEYYLALFTPEQPDLNWDNPEVRLAVYDILRFWLDRGVSGFRMDVINLISKHPDFPDAETVIPSQTYQPGMKYYANGPRMHEYLSEMNRHCLDFYDNIMTVGEMPFVNDEDEILRVVNDETGALNMIFIFELVEIDAQRGDIPGDFRMSVHEWKVTDLKRVINKWQRLMIEKRGWNTLFLENHDQPRSVSHFCDDSDQHREVGSKLLCLMQTTLCGTLFIYQGEELGMRNMPPEWPMDEYKDIESTNYWKKIQSMYSSEPEKLSKGRAVLRKKARDNTRTPMQWTDSPNSGFCPPDVKPWMRVNDDYVTINAANQTRQSQSRVSVYQFWQKCLAMRKDWSDVITYGDFELVDGEHISVFAFKRTRKTRSLLTILNFTPNVIAWEIPLGIKFREWMIGNYFTDVPQKDGNVHIKMQPWEGLVAIVD